MFLVYEVFLCICSISHKEQIDRKFDQFVQLYIILVIIIDLRFSHPKSAHGKNIALHNDLITQIH